MYCFIAGSKQKFENLELKGHIKKKTFACQLDLFSWKLWEAESLPAQCLAGIKVTDRI